MNTINLCRMLEEISYVVIAIQDGEIIDAGSGVAINGNGDLLTAAHVISRLPPTQSDLKDSGISIIARRKYAKFHQYKIGVIAPTMKSPLLISPLIIDLAILKSIEPLNVPFPLLNNEKIIVGSKVLMAGFPDEVELPFSFDKIINYEHPDIPSEWRGIIRTHRQLMIKSGMISYSSGFRFNDAAINREISGEIYYIDNVMHPGSSGGPVINENGELIGIITERAITEVKYEETPKLKVPSGSAVAISASTLLPFIYENLGSARGI